MPKLIDHAERDRVIARAAWRVLLRTGLPGFSVRNVAEEAQLATASLRRRFPSQDALRIYCLRLVGERVQERIDAIDRSLDPRAYVLACLEQLLPLDSERRTEMEVFLALASLAPADAGVRTAYEEAHDSIALACLSLLGSLPGAPDEPTLRVRARRLHAIVDGLSLHLVRAPASDDTAWALDILREEVTSLANASPIATAERHGSGASDEADHG